MKRRVFLISAYVLAIVFTAVVLVFVAASSDVLTPLKVAKEAESAESVATSTENLAPVLDVSNMTSAELETMIKEDGFRIPTPIELPVNDSNLYDTVYGYITDTCSGYNIRSIDDYGIFVKYTLTSEKDAIVAYAMCDTEDSSKALLYLIKGVDLGE